MLSNVFDLCLFMNACMFNTDLCSNIFNFNLLLCGCQMYVLLLELYRIFYSGRIILLKVDQIRIVIHLHGCNSG